MSWIPRTLASVEIFLLFGYLATAWKVKIVSKDPIIWFNWFNYEKTTWIWMHPWLNIQGWSNDSNDCTIWSRKLCDFDLRWYPFPVTWNMTLNIEFSKYELPMWFLNKRNGWWFRHPAFTCWTSWYGKHPTVYGVLTWRSTTPWLWATIWSLFTKNSPDVFKPGTSHGFQDVGWWNMMKRCQRTQMKWVVTPSKYIRVSDLTGPLPQIIL